MCGRYTIYTKSEALQKRFQTKIHGDFFGSRYNAAPSQALPVILNSDSAYIIAAQWGFLPSWAKDKTFKPVINARAETISTKPMFRHAVKNNRCLVLADGFYEWKKAKEGKIPYYITLKDGAPFAFAGIWSVLEDADRALLTFAIITTEPNSLMKEIHDRMPVILSPTHESQWLDPTVGGDEVNRMLKPFAASKMQAYPVSTKVNAPSIDVPELIQKL